MFIHLFINYRKFKFTLVKDYSIYLSIYLSYVHSSIHRSLNLGVKGYRMSVCIEYLFPFRVTNQDQSVNR